MNNFIKEKTLGIGDWGYSFNVIKIVACYEHITGGVNIYLYDQCVSLLAPEYTVCPCMCVCVCVCIYVISNQSTSKRPHYMSDFSTPDALLDKTHIKVLLKVLSYQVLTSIDPSKIAHQMWHDHPFRQRNKTTEIACGCEG